MIKEISTGSLLFQPWTINLTRVTWWAIKASTKMRSVAILINLALKLKWIPDTIYSLSSHSWTELRAVKWFTRPTGLGRDRKRVRCGLNRSCKSVGSSSIPYSKTNSSLFYRRVPSHLKINVFSERTNSWGCLTLWDQPQLTLLRSARRIWLLMQGISISSQLRISILYRPLRSTKPIRETITRCYLPKFYQTPRNSSVLS